LASTNFFFIYRQFNPSYHCITSKKGDTYFIKINLYKHLGTLDSSSNTLRDIVYKVNETTFDDQLLLFYLEQSSINLDDLRWSNLWILWCLFIHKFLQIKSTVNLKSKSENELIQLIQKELLLLNLWASHLYIVFSIKISKDWKDTLQELILYWLEYWFCYYYQFFEPCLSLSYFSEFMMH